ncbi:hypothetical protein HYX10_03240 [Candidatus Woesearchaeota archaeon]|nr:hypothetical protein [Candidatus Woesearchaeota archaeon]
MSKAEFLGARLEKDIVRMIEDTASEERVDKTKALKELILIGRKQFLLRKHMELYRQGKCSIDKAAEKAGVTVSEMMQEAAKAGVKSTETLEDYRRGLELLSRA